MNFTWNPAGSSEELRPVDLKLNRTWFWVGQAGLEARVSPRLGLYLLGEGSFPAQDKFEATTAPDVVGEDQTISVSWKSSNFEWWVFDGGFKWILNNKIWAGLIGLKRDHVSFGLQAPNNIPIDEEDFAVNYNADVLMKLWIPYVGLHLTGVNFKAWCVGSPFVSSDVKIPFRYTEQEEQIEFEATENQFTLQKTGGFLEAFFEYSTRLAPGFDAGLWARANWLKISGNGRQQVSEQPDEVESETHTAHLSRYTYGLGLSASLQF